MCDLFESRRRDAAAVRDDVEKRSDLFGTGGTAEGDEQHRVVPHASAPVGQLVDDLDEGFHVLDGRVLVNAVTQVEDVARPAAGRVQNGLRALPYICGRGQG